MSTYRDAAQKVSIYNDGLFVYLYDESFRDALGEMQGVAVATGADDRQDAAGLRKALMAKRMMLVYELLSDDPINCEVIVGDPLTKKEKKRRKWLKVQKALINLPTGALRIESGNSLSLPPSSPGDEGCTVQVPPGDYVLSLFRVNPADIDDEVEDVNAPSSEVLVLTPVAETKPPKKWDPFLTWEQASGIAPLRLDEPTLEAGHARGLVFKEYNSTLTNLSAQALAELGVRFGDVLDVEMNGNRQRACYIGHFSTAALTMVFRVGPLLQEGLPPLAIALHYHDRQRRNVARLDPWNAGELKATEEPTPITLRTTGESLLPPPLPASDGGERLPDRQLRARVLLATPACVLLDVDDDVLVKHLAIGWTDPVSIEYQGVTRSVQRSNQVLLEKEAFITPLEAPDAASNAEVQVLAARIAEIETARMSADSLESRNRLHLEQQAAEEVWHLARIPEARRIETPLYGSPGAHMEDGNARVMWLKPLIGGAFFQDFTPGDTVVLKPV